MRKHFPGRTFVTDIKRAFHLLVFGILPFQFLPANPAPLASLTAPGYVSASCLSSHGALLQCRLFRWWCYTFAWSRLISHPLEQRDGKGPVSLVSRETWRAAAAAESRSAAISWQLPSVLFPAQSNCLCSLSSFATAGPSLGVSCVCSQNHLRRCFSGHRACALLFPHAAAHPSCRLSRGCS